MWCIPHANPEYVACMEDVLDQYEQPYDPKRPLVCFDEGLKQLIEETRMRIPAKPGRRERYDYEYKRNGVQNLHIFFEPLTGQRQVRITSRRRRQEFAECMRWLVDEVHPEAELIRVVLDNLNTHKPAALYVAFPPAEALRILRKLEFHYTPKHGSWLNMAEIEWSVYSRCLRKHIPDEIILCREVEALTNERNQKSSAINWQFRAKDARIKLIQLYPSILE
jgi:hypothetical protein